MFSSSGFLLVKYSLFVAEYCFAFVGSRVAVANVEQDKNEVIGRIKKKLCSDDSPPFDSFDKRFEDGLLGAKNFFKDKKWRDKVTKVSD